MKNPKIIKKSKNHWKNPKIWEKIQKFEKKFKNLRKNPKIIEKIQKSLKKSKDHEKSQNHEKILEISKIMKKSQNHEKIPKIWPKIIPKNMLKFWKYPKIMPKKLNFGFFLQIGSFKQNLRFFFTNRETKFGIFL